MNLFLSLLPRQTRKALDFFSKQAWLEKSGWYLAGGTALGLVAGHRRSVDLDFFTELKEISTQNLLSEFINNPQWQTTINMENTVYGELFKAKVSFIAYPFFVPQRDIINYGFVKILQPHDIAVMKVIAISQRGRKRDFIDLYWCAKNVLPLEQIITGLKTQYPSVAHNYHHILKSLIYFKDAEDDPMPELKFKAGWKEIKKYFLAEIPIIADKLIL